MKDTDDKCVVSQMNFPEILALGVIQSSENKYTLQSDGTPTPEWSLKWQQILDSIEACHKYSRMPTDSVEYQLFHECVKDPAHFADNKNALRRNRNVVMSCVNGVLGMRLLMRFAGMVRDIIRSLPVKHADNELNFIFGGLMNISAPPS